MSVDPLLEAKDVRRIATDGTRLLDNISLTIPTGSATAIVGAPGSGKTLLLRTLGLLDPINDGEILFHGESIVDQDVPAFRRRVMLVPQRAALIEGTVRQNLTLPFRFRQNADRKFEEGQIVSLLGQLGRDHSFLTQESEELSGGESQIVALVRALQLDPNVLLLDEPTSSLDDTSTAAIEQLLSDWRTADAERAIVIVTHSLEQAVRLADQAVRMQNGTIVSSGDAA